MWFKYFQIMVWSFLLSGGLQACQKTNEKLENQSEYRTLNYSLTPVLNNDKGNSLVIELDFTGDSDGETEIVLGQAWADEQTPWTRFKNISLTSNGQTLPFNNNESRLTVIHDTDAPLKLTYYLHQNDGRKADGDSGFFYAPVLQDDMYHLIGWSSLAVPLISKRNPTSKRTARVKLNWHLPENWQSSASFDVNAQKSIPLDEIFRTSITAGNFNVTSRALGNKHLSVIMTGKWPFSEKQFADKLSHILTALNTSWDDSPVDYQVSLLPIPPIPNGSSITGTGLNHAFAAAGTENLQLDFLTMFLTHEMTHDWIPNRLGSFPTCEEENRDCSAAIYWFSEGFTEFYALSLLKEYELISHQTFIEKTNKNLREYYLSPARNVSNVKIQDDFWNNPDVERQPYLRGFLLALNWDFDIAKKTKGKFNITNALRSLKNKAQKQNGSLPELTQNYLASHFNEWTELDTIKDIEAYIIAGNTIIPNPDALGSCITMELKRIYRYSLGFDVDASLGSGIFSGVDKSHNAHRAGLRDGQEFISKVKGGGGDTTQPIVLKIKDKEKVSNVSYLPIGNDSLQIPQFVKAVAKDCPAIAPQAQ